jgi:hypothetical protein
LFVFQTFFTEKSGEKFKSFSSPLSSLSDKYCIEVVSSNLVAGGFFFFLVFWFFEPLHIGGFIPVHPIVLAK